MRTEAAQRLLDDWTWDGRPDDAMEDYVVAIEAEARHQVLDELREKVAGLEAFDTVGGATYVHAINRARVLSLIDSIRDADTPRED